MNDSNTSNKEEAIEKAIRDGGFYGSNGVWNSIKKFSNDDTLYRERVETIIIRNKKEIFVKKKPNGEYFLPGGSTEKDSSHMDQAVRECEEEAHVKVSNIESTGITYKEKQDPPKWALKESLVTWGGSITEIYIGTYDGKFNEEIPKEDQDPFILSGKWYPIKECFKFFRKEHRDALYFYLKNHQESNTTPITESYISNYFQNKRFLKKIGNTPEVSMEAILQIISIIKKEYIKLSAKSKIQRLRRSNDVKTTFYPITTLDFPDKETVTFCLSFDDAEFTPGAAMMTDEYGPLILIYPSFFKDDRDTQVMTLLHEIGHIRLKHLETKNRKYDIFGNMIDSDVYRTKAMLKNKVIYPELNADYYAVLHGAKLYTFLTAGAKKDTDDEIDYRFTNQELANRYTITNKRYQKTKQYYSEGGEDFMKNNKFIARMVIHEMAYDNPKTILFTEAEKGSLYKILNEYCINRNDEINNDCDEITEDSSYSYIINKKEKYKELFKTEMTKISDKLKENIIMENATDKTSNFIFLLEAVTNNSKIKTNNSFGLEKERKFKLNNEEDVKRALKHFNYVDNEDKEELAINIKKAMKRLNMPDSIIGKKNEIKSYI